MMCQLKEMSLWVLRGILSQGGEKCPGLFLYIRVEDYSDWITSKTRKTSSPLSSFHHWENPRDCGAWWAAVHVPWTEEPGGGGGVSVPSTVWFKRCAKTVVLNHEDTSDVGMRTLLSARIHLTS